MAQTSIGQLDTVVTPLQMAAQAMTLANKGTRYETHIIKSIQSYNFDQTIQETKPVVAAKLENKNSTFDIIKEGMIGAAKDVPQNKVLGYDIAIKTGTPQQTSTITNSALIGYAPAENPEIAISIYIEQGSAAKKMISRIIQAYEKTKTMQPEYPQTVQTLLP